MCSQTRIIAFHDNGSIVNSPEIREIATQIVAARLKRKIADVKTMLLSSASSAPTSVAACATSTRRRP